MEYSCKNGERERERRDFKVEWDTLQHFQGWQDSKNDYNHGF